MAQVIHTVESLVLITSQGPYLSPEETSGPACLERWCVIPGRVQEHSCLGPLFPHKRPSFSRGDMDRWGILGALVGEGKGLSIMVLSWSQQFICNQPTKGFPRVPGPERGSLRDPDPAIVAQAWIPFQWPSGPHLVQSLSHLHDQIPDKKKPQGRARGEQLLLAEAAECEDGGLHLDGLESRGLSYQPAA